MESDSNLLDRQQLAPFFERWELMKEQIEHHYNQKKAEAVELMELAIANYDELLVYGGKTVDKRSKKLLHTLLPLNGEERFNFVKDKIASHYAYIQLEALYSETRKKAARLLIS